MVWTDTPENAWNNCIKPSIGQPKWIENSRDISKDVKLSKRELFGLILFAQTYSDGEEKWLVGYDPLDTEPNDGFITNGSHKIKFEHKVVAQMDKREALNALIETYKKYAAKGKAYGEDRYLIIHMNKTAQGLIKVSDLKDLIDNAGECPFDAVFTIGSVAFKREISTAVMHIIKHFPKVNYSGGGGLTQIDFNLATGHGDIPHNGIKKPKDK